MHKLLLTSCLFLALCSSSLWGQYNWVETSAPEVTDRYDDIYFMNTDTGWAINPYASFFNERGRVIKTTDGGLSWDILWDSAGAVFRAMSFLDADLGFIGTLESGLGAQDTALMYKTTDGGSNWAPVSNLPGPRPGGVCGMYRINDSTLYAGGRYYGPATFYKTTNRGDSWTAINLDSLAGGLVDMYFWNADSGIVVGSSGLPFLDSASVVLFTGDGGQTWERKFRGQNREICWKISFPSKNTGYISVQSLGNANRNFLKTTDQGQTWTSGFFDISNYVAQGCGFVNDSTGWIGGNPGNTALRFTSDGGQSWSTDQWGKSVNRFRFITDSVAYAGGSKIYRLELVTGTKQPDDAQSLNVFPIPSTGKLNIQVPGWQGKEVKIELRDMQGRSLQSLHSGTMNKGKQTLLADLQGLSPGVYFVHVEVEGSVLVRKVILSRQD